MPRRSPTSCHPAGAAVGHLSIQSGSSPYVPVDQPLRPIFYVISGFRAGFLGTSDSPLWVGAAGLLVLNLILWAICYMARKAAGRSRPESFFSERLIQSEVLQAPSSSGIKGETLRCPYRNGRDRRNRLRGDLLIITLMSPRRHDDTHRTIHKAVDANPDLAEGSRKGPLCAARASATTGSR